MRSKETYVVWGFFVAALLIGLAAAPRYGVSWDEPNMLNLGTEAVQYILGNGEWPVSTIRRFHGPLVEILLYSTQKILGIDTPYSIFVLRHILTYVIFLGGLAAFYALAKRMFADWKLALIGTVMLFLSPRIFAHAFYNSRDIPNLVLFTVSMLTLNRALEKPTKKRILIHALATAAAIAVRTISVLIIPISLIMLINRQRKKSLATVALYLAATAACTYALWPLLWEAPLTHLKDAMLFSGSLQRTEYYFGIMQIPPWHYLPVWITITTPVLYGIFFLGGIIPAVKRHLWIPLLWFFLPVVVQIVARIGIYDAWRHMYFIYPALLLIALAGVQCLPRKNIAIGVLTASFVCTSLWMVLNHPLQDSYFSLPGKLVDDRMERDYWGLSFKEGLLWILNNDPRETIGIAATSPPGYFSAFTLPEKLQKRIVFRKENHDYMLDNFRESHYKERFPEELLVHEIRVDGLRVLGVYKIR